MDPSGSLGGGGSFEPPFPFFETRLPSQNWSSDYHCIRALSNLTGGSGIPTGDLTSREPLPPPPPRPGGQGAQTIPPAPLHIFPTS